MILPQGANAQLLCDLKVKCHVLRMIQHPIVSKSYYIFKPSINLCI